MYDTIRGIASSVSVAKGSARLSIVKGSYCSDAVDYLVNRLGDEDFRTVEWLIDM